MNFLFFLLSDSKMLEFRNLSICAQMTAPVHNFIRRKLKVKILSTQLYDEIRCLHIQTFLSKQPHMPWIPLWSPSGIVGVWPLVDEFMRRQMNTVKCWLSTDSIFGWCRNPCNQPARVLSEFRIIVIRRWKIDTVASETELLPARLSCFFSHVCVCFF